MSVDPIYRPGSRWFMTPTTYGAVRKLADSQARPLLADPLITGQLSTLLGSEVVLIPEMDSSGTAKKVIVYGDLSNYIIRDAGPVRVLRDDYSQAAKDEVSIRAWHRTDGQWAGPTRALSAGTTA
jgi:HK97 family phage major capsid protein